MLVLIFSHAHGQNNSVIDSLESVLKHKIGAARYEPLHRLAVEYVGKDDEKALEITLRAEEAALESKNKLSIVKCRLLKGRILYRLERTAEAISVLESVLPLAQNERFLNECLVITNVTGTSYLYQGQYDKALQYYFETVEVSKQAKDTAYMARSLNNIGITYYKLKDYGKSLQFLQRSLELKKIINEPLFTTLINISLCYSNLGNFLKAEYNLQEGLKFCGPKCSDQEMVHVKYASAYMLLGLTSYKEAEAELRASYAYAMKVQDSRMQLDNIFLLTNIYIREKRFKDAFYYLEEAEGLIQLTTHFPVEMLKIYLSFSKLYLHLGNYKKVAHYQDKYISLKDSVFNEALTSNLMKIESEVSQRENKEKIHAQTQAIALQEEIIERQFMTNIVTSLLGFIIFFFLIFLHSHYQRKKELNNRLEQKIKERTRELESSRNLLLKRIQEKDLEIQRGVENVVETINTIKGICTTASIDLRDPAACSYLSKIDTISSGLKTLLRSSENGPGSVNR